MFCFSEVLFKLNYVNSQFDFGFLLSSLHFLSIGRQTQLLNSKSLKVTKNVIEF